MLNPQSIIDVLPLALADEDIEAIHEYCEAENRRIIRLKQANARVRAARIREIRSAVIRRVCDANVAEFNRILSTIKDDRIAPAIRAGVLPERID